jgi:hypothetical protein
MLAAAGAQFDYRESIVGQRANIDVVHTSVVAQLFDRLDEFRAILLRESPAL